jgi:hypothetical protein
MQWCVSVRVCVCVCLGGRVEVGLWVVIFGLRVP